MHPDASEHNCCHCLCHVLCSINTLLEQAGQPFLAECSIPAPLVMGPGKAVLLDCLTSRDNGRVALRSLLGSGGAARLHFVAAACSTLDKSLDCSASSTLPSGLLLAAVQSTTSLQKILVGSQPSLPLELPATATTAATCGVRCTAQISLAQSKTAGWWAHPAVADNVLHLGPATADVGSLAGDAGVTRVVAGIAAYAIWRKASDLKLLG